MSRKTKPQSKPKASPPTYADEATIKRQTARVLAVFDECRFIEQCPEPAVRELLAVVDWNMLDEAVIKQVFHLIMANSTESIGDPSNPNEYKFDAERRDKLEAVARSWHHTIVGCALSANYGSEGPMADRATEIVQLWSGEPAVAS